MSIIRQVKIEDSSGAYIWAIDANGIGQVNLNNGSYSLAIDANGYITFNNTTIDVGTVTTLPADIDIRDLTYTQDNVKVIGLYDSSGSYAWAIDGSGYGQVNVVNRVNTTVYDSGGNYPWTIDYRGYGYVSVAEFPRLSYTTDSVTAYQGSSPWVSSIYNSGGYYAWDIDGYGLGGVRVANGPYTWSIDGSGYGAVNVMNTVTISATDFDIRDLSISQDSIKTVVYDSSLTYPWAIDSAGHGLNKVIGLYDSSGSYALAIDSSGYISGHIYDSSNSYAWAIDSNSRGQVVPYGYDYSSAYNPPLIDSAGWQSNYSRISAFDGSSDWYGVLCNTDGSLKVQLWDTANASTINGSGLLRTTVAQFDTDHYNETAVSADGELDARPHFTRHTPSGATISSSGALASASVWLLGYTMSADDAQTMSITFNSVTATYYLSDKGGCCQSFAFPILVDANGISGAIGSTGSITAWWYEA